MKKPADARRLARGMVAIGRAMNRPTVALLTEMNRPLGRAVGNAVEVAEAIDCLRGRGPADLMEVTLALTAKMVVLGGLERGERAARARLRTALNSGAALAKFREVVAAQGGDPRVVDDVTRLPQAKRVVDVRGDRGGFVTDVDAMDIALAAMKLGAGRERIEDAVDPAVGLTGIVPAGTRVRAGDVLCRLHVGDERHLAAAHDLARGAFTIGPKKPVIRPLVREEIG